MKRKVKQSTVKVAKQNAANLPFYQLKNAAVACPRLALLSLKLITGKALK